MKHTPGPWTVRKGHQPFVTAPSPNGPHEITIAECPHPVGGVYGHQRAGNARLIAAALPMLEACKRALPDLELFARDYPDEPSLQSNIGRVKDAIRQAEGK